MRRQKEKGFTTLELLACFIITSVIMISMFTVILNFRERQQIESIRNRVTAYDYSVTKLIQDDIIQRHLVGVSQPGINQIILYFSQGPSMRLTIDNSNPEVPAIVYGSVGQEIRYPVPGIDDLRIENTAYFTNDRGFLSIRVVLAHPDLKGDYGLSIVAPIG